MMLLLRFVVGGLLVSLFAVLGELIKPKSLAGVFGAAPSVALAGLILTWSENGAADVTTQAQAMICGSLALVLYAVTCYFFVAKTSVRPWLASGLLWLEWLGAAFLLYQGALK